MTGYATFGTNDLARAAAFYDALPERIGARRIMDLGRGGARGMDMDKPSHGAMTPCDGNTAPVGNGVTTELVVNSRDKVNRPHGKALELGGRDEVPVGRRGDGLCAGRLRQLDGDERNLFCLG